MICALSEDSDQPGHPPNLIRVFAVPGIRPVLPESSLWAQWVAKDPSFFSCGQRRLIRLGGCPSWSESSLAHMPFCWVCHEAAQVTLLYCMGYYHVTVDFIIGCGCLWSDLMVINWQDVIVERGEEDITFGHANVFVIIYLPFLMTWNYTSYTLQTMKLLLNKLILGHNCHIYFMF